MIKVDELKLVEVIEETIVIAFRLEKLSGVDIWSIFSSITINNKLNMNSDDLQKFFLAFEGYFEEKISWKK